MLETIKLLIELAEKDQAIRRLESRNDAIPQKIKALEDELERVSLERDENADNGQQCEEVRRQLSLELDEIRSNIGKSQSKQSQVKTDREYWAQIKETDDLKSQLKQKEEEILEQMSVLETFENNKDSLEQAVSKAREKFQSSSAVLNKESEELSREIEKLVASRQSIIGSIPGELLQRYEMVAKVRGGVALAGVRDGVCMACNMLLPPQQYNELLRNDRLLTCGSCQRIMYWMDHEDFQDLTGKNESSGSSTK